MGERTGREEIRKGQVMNNDRLNEMLKAEAEERLIKGICEILKELDIDVKLAEKDLHNLKKNELIEKFVEVKEIRLIEENIRLIDFLIN